MNLLPFVFWSVWAVKVILKISAILLKASCFWGCQSISIVFIVLGGYVILPLNWATHKGKRQIGSDSELRWVFLCGSCSPWHFSTVLDGLKIHQACFIFQSKQELTQKYRFFTLLWPTLTTTHCFDTIQRKILFEFWVLTPIHPIFHPCSQLWEVKILTHDLFCESTIHILFWSMYLLGFYLGTENTSWVNPIPTGQGRNQPLYECHVTKSGRNRGKLQSFLFEAKSSRLFCNMYLQKEIQLHR